MERPDVLFPTTLVGSYPQPDWLIDRKKLTDIVPPRARAPELWRMQGPLLDQAQDDATILAIRDQERAGIDVVTDGEIRRESYSNRFATALEGMDSDNPAEVPSRTAGRVQIVPRVVGKLRRSAPVQVRDVAFLRAQTDKPIRITIPGPFTMTQQLFDEHYHDEAALAMDCAVALNDEIKDLFAAGADVVQLDEPFLQAQPDKARRFGIAAINRALEGAQGTTAIHLCFGYAARVSTKPSGYSFLPELDACKADQISIETAQPKLDCAILSELPSKHIILGVKLKAMADAAAILRREVSGKQA
jgi:5-methyltetrahydropteroyltriglutamate--homocysteine methyltransferase